MSYQQTWKQLMWNRECVSILGFVAFFWKKKIQVDLTKNPANMP